MSLQLLTLSQPMQEGQKEMREIPLRDIRNVKVTLAEALFPGENWADSFEVSNLQQKIDELKAALTKAENQNLQQKIDDMKAKLTKDENQPMQEGQEEMPEEDIRNVKVTLAEALFPGENWAESFGVSPKTRGQEEMREILQQKIVDLKAELTKAENLASNFEVSQKTDDLKAALTKAENLASNFEVSIVTLDYGMKNKDPINNTYFYSKDDLKRGFKIPEDQKSKLLPTTFSEKIMRVYCKNPKNITLKQAREAFKKWCKKSCYTEPVDGDRVDDVE